eukprot:GFUD01042418.1.p1 GENE.GFUD01042418.1~~GFUD01042418.1.p1  ORF type:complete len:255 (+),score=65.90 GFUD01042418.1:80-766(+)
MFRPIQIFNVLLSISFLQVSSKPQTNFGDIFGGQDVNGLLNDPNIQGALNNLGGQDLSGLLNNPNVQGVLNNIGGQDLNGLLNNPNIQGVLNNLGGQDVTGLLNNENNPNLQEILKKIDLENLNLDNIDLGPHKDAIEKAINIIKVSSPEDLGDLSEAIEANPDSLPDILGVDSNIDPEIVKIVAGWIKSEANRMATISPPQVIQSGSSRAALSLFFAFCLIVKITFM